MRIRPIFIFVLLILALAYQNCAQDVRVNFFSSGVTTLKSEIDGGGGGYNGKPDHGYYCRVFDNIPCQTQVPNQQGLVKVDSTGIHLVQDMCSSTSLNFQPEDASVEFSVAAKNFLGISRGIFKKCDVNSNNLPQPPTQMTDVYCVSPDKGMTVVINKNLSSQVLNVNLSFIEGTNLRTAHEDAVIKSSSANGSGYSSVSQSFSLQITKSNSQTSPGHLQASIDDKQIDINLNCRSANSEATIISAKDLEISPTWIDISKLVGHWKLNETNASEGTTIFDSSAFASSGTLFTGDGGKVKSDTSVIDGALSFDGTGDYVRVLAKDISQYNFGMNSFTYILWLKKTGSVGTIDVPFWHGGSSGVYPGFDIECAIGCVASISDGLTQPTSVATARFLTNSNDFLGRWIMLTAVIDRQSNQLRTYLDGVLMNTKNISTLGSINSNLDLFIGRP